MSDIKLPIFEGHYDKYENEENPTTNTQMQHYTDLCNKFLQDLAKSGLTWQSETQYIVDDTIWLKSGLHAKCIVAGTSGMLEPIWNDNQEIVDGGVRWLVGRAAPINIGAANAGKLLIVNKSGNIEPFATGDVVSVHNAIWGGRDLVAEFGSIANIITAVQAGDFSNIFVSDYIPVTPFDAGYGTSDNKAYVAEIKGYENMGDTSISANHLVMTMSCGSRKMNDTNTTTGGYLGTKVHTEAMPAIQTKLEQIFGASHILTPRVYLTNTVNDSTPSMAGGGTNGAATNAAWTSVKCWLPNEINVYGSPILSSSLRDCMGYPKHLAIYRHKEHARLWGRSAFWLSCVYASGTFCAADSRGYAAGGGASLYSLALRPLFLLG